MKRSVLCISLVCALLAALLLPVGAAEIPEALAREANRARAQGAAWLAEQQQENGHWSVPDTPALSALCFWALLKTQPAAYQAQIDKAAEFVLQFVQEDGSIFKMPRPGERGGGLANYNTAVNMMALFDLQRQELIPVIQRARYFVARTQNLGGSVYRGGMGYDPNAPREYADLSNSSWSYEAMRYTESVEDFRAEGEERVDLDWDAVQQFLANMQNLPAVNTNTWVSDDEADLGGFIYTPRAGGQPGGGGEGRQGPPPEGKPAMAEGAQRPPMPEGGEPIRIRSYGSMTYAGLLALVYANVARDDERVTSAQDWARRHWTLAENPGQGPNGLYYFYHILAKCLDAYGDVEIVLPNGETVIWREELIRQILSLQKEDGSWVNFSNRWWEADPCLVTAYTLLTLEKAMGGPLPE